MRLKFLDLILNQLLSKKNKQTKNTEKYDKRVDCIEKILHHYGNISITESRWTSKIFVAYGTSSIDEVSKLPKERFLAMKQRASCFKFFTD